MARTSTNKAKKNKNNKPKGNVRPRARSSRAGGGTTVLRAIRPPDSTKARYLACTANPFTGPISRGISGSHPVGSSAVARTFASYTVSITNAVPARGTNPGNPSVGGGAGVDFIVPLGSTGRPALVCSSSGVPWDVPVGSVPATTGYWTNAYGATGSGLIPDGSVKRIVSSGVRITSLGPADQAGGMFFVWSPPYTYAGLAVGGTAGGQGGANQGPGMYFGDSSLSQEDSIARATVRPGGVITFVLPPQDQWFTTTDANVTNYAANANVVGASKPMILNYPHFRFYYVGPPTTLYIEIAAVQEWYHDSHLMFSAPAVTHPDGVMIHQAVNAYLSEPRSNNAIVKGGTTTLAQKLESITNTVTKGAELFVTGVKSAVTAKQGWNVLKNVYSAGARALPIVEEAAEGMALLTL